MEQQLVSYVSIALKNNPSHLIIIPVIPELVPDFDGKLQAMITSASLPQGTYSETLSVRTPNGAYEMKCCYDLEDGMMQKMHRRILKHLQPEYTVSLTDDAYVDAIALCQQQLAEQLARKGRMLA